MARPLGNEPPHGTRKRYQLRRDPCRSNCPATPSCADANAWFVTARRQLRRRLASPLRTWDQPSLPDELLPACTHSLMAGASKCTWCGADMAGLELCCDECEFATAIDNVPALVDHAREKHARFITRVERIPRRWGQVAA